MLSNSAKKAIMAIQAEKLDKSYGSRPVLHQINLNIEEGRICSLIGMDGAGKSTLMRILAGVFPPTHGTLRIFGAHPLQRDYLGNKISFLPDVPYFLPGATINKMVKFYGGKISYERLEELCEKLNLNMNEKITHFSKGHKQLAAIVLALSRQPGIFIADEAFDGLSPVIKAAIKKLIIGEVQSRKMTVIVSSHSLREMEDFCDNLIILHKGEIIEQTDINTLKEGMFKGQIIFSDNCDLSSLASEYGFKLLSSDKSDILTTFIAEGGMIKIREKLMALSPIVLKLQPLSLEEIFIQRTLSKGYDYSSILGRGNNTNG